MTVASIFPSLMARIALAEPAPPMKAISWRLALSSAAWTPTPWSSSWFQRMSIFGAAWSRLDAAASPVSTVKPAATRLSTVSPHFFSASLNPRQRQRVDAGDLRDDGVRDLVARLDRAGVRAGRDTHAVVVAEDRGARGERARELAVDVDDRDARSHRLRRDGGERGAVGRQQHDRVDLVVDEGLDLADLQVRVVRSLSRTELDVAVLLRLVGRR